MGSSVLLIIRAERLVKLPEGLINPVAIFPVKTIFSVAISVISVQLVIGVIIVEGGIDVEDIVALGLRT